MKNLKRFIITLFILIFISLKSAVAQSEIIIEPTNELVSTNESCHGCASLYIFVSTRRHPVAGLYYYDIYLYTDSYNDNAYQIDTYVNDLKVFALDVNGHDIRVLNIGTHFKVIPPNKNYDGYLYIGFVATCNSTQTIRITWSSISTTNN